MPAGAKTVTQGIVQNLKQVDVEWNMSFQEKGRRVDQRRDGFRLHILWYSGVVKGRVRMSTLAQITI